MRPSARLPQLILVGLLSAVALPDAGGAEPVVELVTVGPDHAIDTRFGHILLRVIDTETGVDDVYDFGVADFQRPGFVAEAAMGRARFWLRRSSSKLRFDQYVLRDRQIETQRLNLTDDQVAYLIERLEWNLRPENVEYAYDHVADNCSTRLRDLLNDATGKAVQQAAYGMGIFRTYREDILGAGSGRILALIAYDLGTGPHGEDRVSAWQLSFLPDQLRGILAVTENPAMGDGAPLVASEAVLHRRRAAHVIVRFSQGRPPAHAADLALIQRTITTVPAAAAATAPAAAAALVAGPETDNGSGSPRDRRKSTAAMRPAGATSTLAANPASDRCSRW